MDKEIENEYDIISLFSESSNESSNEIALSIDESHLTTPQNTNLFMGNILTSRTCSEGILTSKASSRNIENVSKKNGKNKKDCIIPVITGLWALTVYKILTSTS